MADAEAGGEAGGGGKDDVMAGGGIIAHEVGGERGLGGGERPDVEVVHLSDAMEGGEVGGDVGVGDAGGDAVHGEVSGLAQGAPTAPDDDGDDGEADRRVDPQPAGEHDRAGADDNAEGDGGVGQHVLEGGFDVEVVVAAAKEPGGKAVDDDASCSDGHDGRALDGGGVEETVGGFERDGAAAHQQDHGVGESRKDRGAAPAIGAVERGRAGGKGSGEPGQEQAEDVAEIMGCVGEQGDGAGEDAIGELGGDKGDIQRGTDGEGGAERGWRVMVMPVAMRVVVAIVVAVVVIMPMSVVVIMVVVVVVVIVTVACVHGASLRPHSALGKRRGISLT